VKSHTVWRNLHKTITEPPCIEYSVAWEDEEHGVLLRSRPDFFSGDIIIDLKTTKDSSPASFSRAIAEYSYHRQAALACDGLTKMTGKLFNNVILFVVDKTPPYFTRCYVLPQSAINQGRYEYKEAARIYAECIRTQEWPGYPEIIEDLDIPAWAYRTFNNE
jgi:exodeoxyribonuclease VIII